MQNCVLIYRMQTVCCAIDQLCKMNLISCKFCYESVSFSGLDGQNEESFEVRI